MENTQTKDNLTGGGGRTTKQPYRKETYDEFLKWSALSSDEKKDCGLSTAKAFAKEHNIGAVQLSRWRKRAGFKKLSDERLLEKLRSYSPDMWAAFMKRLTTYGIGRDMEFFLLFVKGWSREAALINAREKAKQVTLTEEDIRTAISCLPKERQNKFYDVLVDLMAEARQAQEGIFYDDNDTDNL